MGLAPLFAALILFFVAIAIGMSIIAIFKPTLYIISLLIIGAFAVIIAVVAGPALVRAAGGGR